MIYTSCHFFAFEMNLKWIEHVKANISKCTFLATHLKIFGWFLENILVGAIQNYYFFLGKFYVLNTSFSMKA